MGMENSILMMGLTMKDNFIKTSFMVKENLYSNFNNYKVWDCG